MFIIFDITFFAATVLVVQDAPETPNGF